MKQAFLFLLISGLILRLSAQPGSSCADPYLIPSLPFSQVGMTTDGFGNNYLSTICGTNNYISGNEIIFQYTPTDDQDIRIELSNIGYGVGIFVLKRCMDDPASECVAFITEGSGSLTLNSASLVKDSIYYFVISTYNLLNMNPITAFDISIYEIFDYDLSPINFQRPNATCDMTVDQPINIKIRNFGLNPVSNFDIAYIVNGGPPVVETYSGTINPGEDIYYGFTNRPDMSILGQEYCLKVFTYYSGDGNPNNDTALRCIQHMDWIGGFPYTEDFETVNHNWYTSTEDETQSPTSWELGVPANDSINSASSGTNAWVTNLTGNNNLYENSYVVSPCMDFSSLISPVVEVDTWYCTSEADFVQLTYTIDKGENWVLLGDIDDGGFNWYNTPITVSDVGWTGNSDGWLSAQHALTGLGGVSEIQFRFHFIGNTGTVQEGFAFDNFRIYEAPEEDLGVINVIVPSGCGLGSEVVSVKIVNFGLNTQSNFDVAYLINGSGLVSENVTESVAPGDTLDYSFSTVADLSIPDSYFIKSFTQLPLDMENINDTSSTEVHNFNEISSLPYFEDFESGDGGYFVTGDNPSWQYGTPADSVITHASSGSFCWVTNLTGYHNLLEQSFLTMPCFDFTGIVAPLIEFDIWYETIIMGLQFEASINGGLTWTVIGHMSDPNWYNSGYAWVGASGDWVNVEHILTDFGGISDVQFRFKFYENIESTGVGIDNVRISDVTEKTELKQDGSYIYPNPFNNEISVFFGTEGKYSIKLTNINGQILNSETGNGNKIILNTSEIPAGVYYIFLETENYSKVEKLVKLK